MEALLQGGISQHDARLLLEDSKPVCAYIKLLLYLTNN
jgi:hypothetical protein